MISGPKYFVSSEYEKKWVENQIFHSGDDIALAICKSLNADIYINAIGGQGLYAAEDFRNEGIELRFIKTKPIEYRQFDNEFVPWLSIIDVMMFNSKQQINEMLKEYEII